MALLIATLLVAFAQQPQQVSDRNILSQDVEGVVIVCASPSEFTFC